MFRAQIRRAATEAELRPQFAALEAYADGRQFAAGLPCACTHAHHAEAGSVDDVSGVVGQTFAIVLNGERPAFVRQSIRDVGHMLGQ